MKKYDLKEIWWIKYAVALENYNKGKYVEAKKKLNEIKVNDKKIKLNINFIRFKIFFKFFFNKM